MLAKHLTQSPDFYLKVAGLMEAAAIKHPQGSPCYNRKLKTAYACRLKAAMLQQASFISANDYLNGFIAQTKESSSGQG